MRKRWFLSALTVCLVTALSVCACAAAPVSGFSDVPDHAWYSNAVAYVKEKGYMIGTADDRFSPDGVFTRAQMAAVLYRLAGEPAVSGEDEFSDTEENEWYSDAVLWASQEGIVQGYGNDRFGTGDPVTQEQLITLLWRQAGEPSSASSEETDGASPYAAGAIRWARETILDEAGYTFRPGEPASRGLVAVLTERYDRLNATKERDDEMTLTLKINGTPVPVIWEENASTDALRELAREAPLTVSLSPYGGFEQVGSLGTSLPRSDAQTTTQTGDIVLYSGSNIVLFYGSNTWAYTRLGRLDLPEGEIRDLLGGSGVTVTLTIE